MADSQLHIRLLPITDDAIRDHVRRHGDMARHILAMCASVDFSTVELPSMDAVTRRTGDSGSYTTIANFPLALRKMLKKTAVERECTMNALINGGIIAYAAKLRKKSKSRI